MESLGSLLPSRMCSQEKKKKNVQSGRQSGSQKRELEGDCHQLDPVSEVASVWQWCWRVLIAPELMCLFLTPGAPGFNYCLRSHMQMSLQSFLVPMDGSPDYQPSHFAARWAGRRGGGNATGQAGLPLKSWQAKSDKVVPCLPHLWVFVSWQVQGCVWGVVATWGHWEVACQQQRSPGGPKLPEPLGTEDFYRKGTALGRCQPAEETVDPEWQIEKQLPSGDSGWGLSWRSDS